MSINFSHKSVMSSFKNDFPIFLTNSLRKERILKDDVAIKQISDPYRTGSGNKEKLYDKYIITIDKVSFPLTLVENADGNLDIFFDKKRVWTVGLTGRITSKALVSLVKSVKETLAELV